MLEIDGVKIPSKKSGPPEWIPSEGDYYKVDVCASIGLSEGSIANILGIAPITFIEGKSKYPRIAKSLAGARDNLHYNLVARMVEFINDPDVPYENKRKDIHYILSRKCGWKEQVSLNESAPQLPSNISFQEVTTIEAQDD